MNRNQRIERGRQAKSVLENPLIVEAFEIIDTKLIEKIRDSDLDDETSRQYAFLMMRAMKVFKRHFEQVLMKGENAKIEPQSMRKK